LELNIAVNGYKYLVPDGTVDFELRAFFTFEISLSLELIKSRDSDEIFVETT